MGDERVYGFIVPSILELVERRGKITVRDVAEKLSLPRNQVRNIISQMLRYRRPTQSDICNEGSYLVRLNKGEKIAVYGRGSRMSPVQLREVASGAIKEHNVIKGA